MAFRRWLLPASFLAPALIVLIAINVVPLFYTLTTSFQSYYLPRAAQPPFQRDRELSGTASRDDRFWHALGQHLGLRRRIARRGGRPGLRHRPDADPAEADGRTAARHDPAADHRDADRRRLRLAADVQPDARPAELSPLAGRRRPAGVDLQPDAGDARPDPGRDLAAHAGDHAHRLHRSAGAAEGDDRGGAGRRGAGRARSFGSIKLPLIKPILMVGVLFRVIDLFKTFDIFYILTRGGPGVVDRDARRLCLHGRLRLPPAGLCLGAGLRPVPDHAGGLGPGRALGRREAWLGTRPARSARR